MLTTRQATVNDIPLIHDMAEIVFPHTYKDIISKEQLDFMMDWMYSFDSIKKQITELNHTYFIAFKDDVPVGYVSIRPESDDIFHLEKIYVLPQYQNMNFGRYLFQQAVKAVKERHPAECEIQLNVNRNNKALQFYEHIGMKKVSEGDFSIGNGFFMNDYIMGITV